MNFITPKVGLCCLVLLILFAAGCESTIAPEGTSVQDRIEPAASLVCAPDNDGLTLPAGFCAVLVADSIGAARHLAVRDNGDLYVALRREGSLVALRDITEDGRADVVERFGESGGTGIGLYQGYLYFAPDTMILRYPLPENGLVPSGAPETVVSGFARERQHAAKPFDFDEQGNLYVNVGAPSNACQDPARTPGVPGQDPCPLLENFGGVWRFAADQLGQTVADGVRYATGIRNGVAIDWNPNAGKLYVVQHGRDQLSQLWPDLYTEVENAELPSEEFFEVDEGDDFGWPYCYYDHEQGKKLLGPEYGGDGQAVGRCADAEEPIAAFPGHWAPNDLAFYMGRQFPARYQGGAFIAFHGSWNRAPLPQQGYKVVFVPFADGKVSGDYEVFADGFARADTLAAPGDARYRPMGLAEGADGSLYIVDSRQGRLWRIIYRGTTEE